MSPELRSGNDPLDELVVRLESLQPAREIFKSAVNDSFEIALNDANSVSEEELSTEDRELALELTFARLRQKMSDGLRTDYVHTALGLLQSYDPAKISTEATTPEIRMILENRQLLIEALQNRFKNELLSDMLSGEEQARLEAIEKQADKSISGEIFTAQNLEPASLNEMQSVLDQIRREIKKKYEERSQYFGDLVIKETEESQSELREYYEREELAGLWEIVEKVYSYASAGYLSDAIGMIRRYIEQGDIAAQVRKSLDHTIMDRAASYASTGYMSDAINYVKRYASNTEAAAKMRAVLDDYVLERAEAYATTGYMSDAINYVRRYSSSPEVATEFHRALDSIILDRAYSYVSTGYRSDGTNYVKRYASDPELARQMLDLLFPTAE